MAWANSDGVNFSLKAKPFGSKDLRYLPPTGGILKISMGKLVIMGGTVLLGGVLPPIWGTEF